MKCARNIIVIPILLLMCDSREKVFHPSSDNSTKLVIDIYDKSKAANGTTLLTYRYDTNSPKIVEVNMLGNIVWEYQFSPSLHKYVKYGFDAEMLPNGRILVILPTYAIMEMNRDGDIAWAYNNEKLSHDVDRLDNGHTIMVFGANDQRGDVHIKELDNLGFIAWQWFAKDYFDTAEYHDTYNEGWTRTNAVTRLESGNTLACLCNFHLIAEIDTSGQVIRKIGEGFLYYPYDPEVLDNGNILVTSQKPVFATTKYSYSVVEIDPKSNDIVWTYENSEWFNNQLTRDANRLVNGNTLIIGSTQIIEVTPDGETVWRLKIDKGNLPLNSTEVEERGFYKAQRIIY